MGKERDSKTLGRLVKIKPGEMKLALLLFSYFFLIAASHTIINALRTANFLWKEGVGWLPIAYLFSFVVSGLVVYLHSKVQVKTPVQTLIITSLVFFAVSGLLLQWVLRTGFGQRSAFLSYFYWVWSSTLIIVLITGFWMTVNELYNPRQAKRLIGFLNSGGILGGILGGLLVGFLAEDVLGIWLMPLGCVMLLGCVLVVRAIFRILLKGPAESGRGPAEREVPERQKTGFMDSFRAVRKDRFLTLIAAIGAIGIVVSTCIEFQFLSASYLHYNDEKSLQVFFGFFDPARTIFAFFLNFLMAGYLLRKLTAARTLLLTPIVLLVCSVAVLFAPFGLISGIFIRGSDEGLAFSVNHPVREILYIPVTAHLRHKAKAFIEMFVSQFAKVGGAIVLLIFAILMNKEVEGLTPRFDPQLSKNLSWVVIALLVPWIVFSLKIVKEYLATLKVNIQPLWDRAEKGLTEKVDVEYAKLVFDTIDSRNYSSVLYALHLFDLLAQDKLSPEFKKIIAEKTEEVRAKALNDRFEAGAAVLFPETLDEFPPENIMAEIPIILSSEAYQRVMTSYLEAALDGGPNSEIHKMELAKAIGLMDPDSPLAAKLTRLIDDESPGVSGFALKSATRLRKAEYIPAIVRKLGAFINLEDAVDALHKYGDVAVGALERSLHDRSGEFVVRMAIIEVLTRIGTPRAVLALTEELEHGAGELDEGVIDALDRLRSENSEIPLSAAAAERKTYSLIKKFCRTFIAIQLQGPGEEEARLRHHFVRNLEVTFADIFKLLGLFYSQKDIRRAYQNIRAGTRNSVAYAVEWLDNALKKDLKNALLPLVDDLNLAEKTARFQKILEDLADY